MLDELRSLFASDSGGEAPGFMTEMIELGALVLGAALAYFVARRVLVAGIRGFARRSNTHWDDALVEAGVFGRLAIIAPALVFYLGVGLFPDLPSTLGLLIQRVAASVLIAMFAVAAAGAISAVDTIYMANPANRQRPIKGYLQVGSLIVYALAALLVLATLLDRSPLIFLSGIGAMTAILLLVFRDTILSLVASIQLTGNDMIHVGDWIEMPRYGADGDVIDVALHTVKVQNWDKTITSIPTHALISDSFKNWRGMSRSGGRRIKRSLMLDMTSVRFLEAAEVRELGSLALLVDYFAAKSDELESHNQAMQSEAARISEQRGAEVAPEVRQLTNLGTFRAYVERYLQVHPRIHQEMTLLVRQLPPTAQGMPIEIYCFTNTTDWNAYESIQADIFDHLLAIAPRFGLCVFQSPTGTDVRAIAHAG